MTLVQKLGKTENLSVLRIVYLILKRVIQSFEDPVSNISDELKGFDELIQLYGHEEKASFLKVWFALAKLSLTDFLTLSRSLTLSLDHERNFPENPQSPESCRLSLRDP